MFNLQLLHQTLFDVSDDDVEATSKMCFDMDGGVYCQLTDIGSASTGLYRYFPIAGKSQFTSHLDRECYSVIQNENADIIGIQYLVEQQSLCFCASQGDIWILSSDSHELECVGSISNEILAMEWSPDQELLTFVTGNETVVLMTKDFYPLGEQNLHSEEFGSCKPITVGWGSKETQFRGSEGKLVGKSSRETDDSHVTVFDDGKHRIRWRCDGQYFAISSVDPKRKCRLLRIWSREFELLYTSENVLGLEHTLHWGPGNLMTSTKQHPTKHEVTFFETNGLVHGGFALPYKPNSFKVNEVIWNADSSSLAVWGSLILDNQVAITHHLLLYSSSNYHWYLKQTLIFGGPNSKQLLNDVQWDPQDFNVLHVLCKNGQYLRYTWNWTVNRSVGGSANDQAIAAVVDGDKVLVTPFRSCMVPPPMSAYTVHLPERVNNIIFSTTSTNDFALLLCDGRIAVCRYNKCNPSSSITGSKTSLGAAGGTGFKSQVGLHVVERIVNIDFPSELNVIDLLSCRLYHGTWLPEDVFLFVAKLQNGCDALVYAEFANFGCSPDVIEARCVCIMKDKSIYQMSPSNDGIAVAVQCTDGSIYKFCPANKQLILMQNFPQACPTIAFGLIQNKDVVFGLSTYGQLFCNDKTVDSKCRSFCVHDEFLMYVTQDNFLHCVHLEHDLPAILHGGSAQTAEDCTRLVERGARIVLAVACDTRLLLQMPRGNLETIHPRPLVLSAISKWLRDCEYKRCVETMRKLRINLNLLYDFDPRKFLANANHFVQQVDAIDWLVLFLIELKDSNVSKTMYFNICRFGEQSEEDFTNKVNKVSEALIKAMENVDKEKYFVPIVVAYSKMDRIDEALKKIKDFSSNNNKYGARKDEALKQLACLVDINDLYRIALGTYDFDIVIMVAEKSQKDPREFIPLLNELRKFEEPYRRYKIDMHLGRYKKALEHISTCGSEHFNECLDLIKTRSLHREALHLFPAGSVEHKAVWKAYGEYLKQKKYYEEAGAVFNRCQEYELALDCYKLSSNWQMAMAISYKLGFSEAERSILAKRLAELMRSNKRCAEAASLYETYVQDVETAICTSIEGHEWKLAMLLIHRYNRFDLTEKYLEEALADHWSSLNEVITQYCNDFQKHRRRLKVVRETKLQQREFGDLEDEIDTYSDTSSISGISSGTGKASLTASGSISTRRTSRKKRKQEKNKYLLKEGSPNEHLALVHALKELVVATDKLQEDCASLLETLILFEHDDRARELQENFEQLVTVIEDGLSEIWPPEKQVETVTFGPDSTTNKIAESFQKQHCSTNASGLSDPELRVAPALRKSVDWKLCMFGTRGK